MGFGFVGIDLLDWVMRFGARFWFGEPRGNSVEEGRMRLRREVIQVEEGRVQSSSRMQTGEEISAPSAIFSPSP